MGQDRTVKSGPVTRAETTRMDGDPPSDCKAIACGGQETHDVAITSRACLVVQVPH